MRKIKNPLPYPLVLVIWEDACSRSSWEPIEESIEWADNAKEDWIVHEVGWLIKETPDYILLTPQVGKDGVAGNMMKIPRGFIKLKLLLSAGK